MYKLHLKAVDSRNATQAELDMAGIKEHQIPRGEDGKLWQIAAHQAETIRALRFGNAPIIINQAMTGDGKTMAGRFQLLSEKWRTFAMYPTNALAHDQVQSFDELMRAWRPAIWEKTPQTKLINAEEIDQFSFGDGIDVSRMDEIEGMMTRKDYILTNPDIFHLIMNFAYQQHGVASDFLPAFVASRFQLYIFDEFHLFGIEQTASVLIAMLLIKQLSSQTSPPHFLFLSATPQKQLTQLAERVGLEFEEPINGQYVHGDAQPRVGYRRILREVEINLYANRLEDWVKEYFEDIIKPFFLAHKPASKGIIIANSVATAHRIRDYLSPLCENEHINLGINTGLTPKVDRSTTFDLLVATSTVDVGVDFRINFLVFESRDASSHLQRLGRLGRHESDRDGNLFQAFEAHSILPQWTIDGLANVFSSGDTISREEYKENVGKNFSPLQQFEQYIGRWAGVQAGKVLSELRKNEIYTQYRVVRETLETQYKALFGKSVRKYFMLKDAKEFETIKVASSFRGGSTFTCLVQDPETDSKQVKSYNLISLFRNADLRAVPLESLLQQAQHLGQNTNALKKTAPLGAYQLLGWREQLRPIAISLDAELLEDRLETIIEQNRFNIDTLDIQELQKLNDELYERKLVAFVISDKDPDLVRRILRLGFQIELFSFSALGNLTGTIVFGRDALLIDSILRRRKAQSALFW